MYDDEKMRQLKRSSTSCYWTVLFRLQLCCCLDHLSCLIIAGLGPLWDEVLVFFSCGCSRYLNSLTLTWTLHHTHYSDDGMGVTMGSWAGPGEIVVRLGLYFMDSLPGLLVADVSVCVSGAEAAGGLELLDGNFLFSLNFLV